MIILQRQRNTHISADDAEQSIGSATESQCSYILQWVNLIIPVRYPQFQHMQYSWGHVFMEVEQKRWLEGIWFWICLKHAHAPEQCFLTCVIGGLAMVCKLAEGGVWNSNNKVTEKAPCTFSCMQVWKQTNERENKTVKYIESLDKVFLVCKWKPCWLDYMM